MEAGPGAAGVTWTGSAHTAYNENSRHEFKRHAAPPTADN